MSLNKLALILLTSPGAAAPAPRAQYVMGTILEIQAEGAHAQAAQAVTEAFAEVRRWDGLLSLYKKDSELSRLNAAAADGPFVCSPDLWRAVTAALELSRASGGRFDPTVLPLLRRADAPLSLVGVDNVVLDRRRRALRFKARGMGLTLDGFGKGWALDEAAALLRKRGVPALMNFGGQLLAVGAPAAERGWRVVVPGRADPLILRDASASTSGNSEQPGHILDPRTGSRVVGRGAVTVVAPTGAEADAWSTALFVAGPGYFPRRCAIFEKDPNAAPHACRPYLGRITAKGASK